MRNRFREWFSSHSGPRSSGRFPHPRYPRGVSPDRGGGNREWDVYGSPGYEDARPRADEDIVFERPAHDYARDRNPYREVRDQRTNATPVYRDTYGDEYGRRDVGQSPRYQRNPGYGAEYGRHSGYDRGYDHDASQRAGFGDYNRGDYTRGDREPYRQEHERPRTFGSSDYDRGAYRTEPQYRGGARDDYDRMRYEREYDRGFGTDRDFDRIFNDDDDRW